MISGEEIRRLREKKGISQAKLAEKVGVSQAHIAKIESGKVDPRLSTVNRILYVLKEEEKSEKSIKDIMTEELLFVEPEDNISKAVELMREYDISQLPVLEGEKVIGSISESSIVKNFGKNLKKLKVKDIMEDSFPLVSEKESLEVIKSLLTHKSAILVYKDGKVSGIVTKSDLLKLIKF